MGVNPTVKTGLAVIAGAVVLALLLLVGLVAVPGLVGGDDAFVVTSGSMSPTIEAGDVIITQDVDPEEIESGDIVTFHDGSEANTGYVTHRVVDVVEENGERYFELQGDANDEPDEGLVPAEYAQGDLHLHVPYFGYLLLFARSSLGLFVLVIGPGLVLVGSGSWQLLREFGYAPASGSLVEAILGPGYAEDGGDSEPPALEGQVEPPALEPAEDAGLEGDGGTDADAGAKLEYEDADEVPDGSTTGTEVDE
ncbi:signal peptidase I [Natronorubrum sp. JWXQ-INN-674]|uniref:Signal peptidase I n=1 Tax=Natronorubrum halalkaliphilum TaxID=2691917 RepID=A0A6B0VPT6_9EURY|nr:signal peptidase I [Natronorubrum halalkaliphilum]MXV63831.1 signal peptidase I [Natronorubrum halalkaliphilum]